MLATTARKRRRDNELVFRIRRQNINPPHISKIRNPLSTTSLNHAKLCRMPAPTMNCGLPPRRLRFPASARRRVVRDSRQRTIPHSLAEGPVLVAEVTREGECGQAKEMADLLPVPNDIKKRQYYFRDEKAYSQGLQHSD